MVLQRGCMSVKCICLMDTEWFLSRKEIPYKFLCQRHHVNLPLPLKYTGKTQTIRCVINQLHSGIPYVEVDRFIVMNKRFCQISDSCFTP